MLGIPIWERVASAYPTNVEFLLDWCLQCKSIIWMGLELVLGVCLCVLLWAVLCPLRSISNKRRAGQGVLWQVTMWGVPKNHFLQKNLCPTRCSFTSGRAEALSPGGMQWVPGVTETPASGCARCIIFTSSSRHKLNKDMKWPWSMLPPPAPLLVPCLVPASQWWSIGYNFLAIMTNMTPSKSRIMEQGKGTI